MRYLLYAWGASDRIPLPGVLLGIALHGISLDLFLYRSRGKSSWPKELNEPRAQ